MNQSPGTSVVHRELCLIIMVSPHHQPCKLCAPFVLLTHDTSKKERQLSLEKKNPCSLLGFPTFPHLNTRITTPPIHYSLCPLSPREYGPCSEVNLLPILYFVSSLKFFPNTDKSQDTAGGDLCQLFLCLRSLQPSPLTHCLLS